MKTNRYAQFVAAAALAVLVSACEEKKPQLIEKPAPATSNFETARLGTTIDSYIQNPTAGQAADVDRAFAELDGELAELNQRSGQVSGAEKSEAQGKAENLRTYRDKEKLRYEEARVRAATTKAEDAARDDGNKIDDAARKTGEGVKDAAEAVKDGVGNAVDAVREKLP